MSQPVPQATPALVRDPRRPLVASGLLMVVGALLAVVGTFLPWFRVFETRVETGERVQVATQNGWQQIAADLGGGHLHTSGLLMLIAFVATILASAAVVTGAALGLRGRRATVLVLVGTVVGLAGTLGVITGYTVLDTLDHMAVGGWLYSFAFFPVLVGALGHSTRTF